jgi:hypothetical protein
VLDDMTTREMGQESARAVKNGRALGQQGYPIIAPICPTTGPDGRVLMALAADEVRVLRAYWDRRDGAAGLIGSSREG